jgi:hypothetical protein
MNEVQIPMQTLSRSRDQIDRFLPLVALNVERLAGLDTTEHAHQPLGRFLATQQFLHQSLLGERGGGEVLDLAPRRVGHALDGRLQPIREIRRKLCKLFEQHLLLIHPREQALDDAQHPKRAPKSQAIKPIQNTQYLGFVLLDKLIHGGLSSKDVGESTPPL